MVQKAREDYSSDLSNLSDVLDEEHTDAEQYTNIEQNNNYYKELKNAYIIARLSNYNSLPTEEYDLQEPSLEPGDITNKVDDEYNNNRFLSQTPQGPSPKD